MKSTSGWEKHLWLDAQSSNFKSLNHYQMWKRQCQTLSSQTRIAKIPTGFSYYDSMWELKQKLFINFQTFMYMRVFLSRDYSKFLFLKVQKRHRTRKLSWKANRVPCPGKKLRIPQQSQNACSRDISVTSDHPLEHFILLTFFLQSWTQWAEADEFSLSFSFLNKDYAMCWAPLQALYVGSTIYIKKYMKLSHMCRDNF